MATKKQPASQIPIWEAFDSDELKEVWNDWIAFRSEKKFTKYVPTGLKTTMTKLRKLAGGNEKTMIAIIQQSMTGKGWEGFWPLKEEVSIKKDLNNLAAHFTPKEEEMPPTEATQPQKATQTEFPMDLREYWEDCQDKAKKGVKMILTIAVYDWLDKTGQLNLSKDEKIDLFMKAKFAYILELEAGGTPQDRHRLREMKTEGWGNNQELLQTVTSKAKILGAKEFLYQTIKQQTA